MRYKVKQQEGFIGKKFNRLTVIEFMPPLIKKDGFKRTMVKCKCDCGTEINRLLTMVEKGYTKSCGCLIIDTLRLGNHRTHGLSKTSLMYAYDDMVKRCTNDKALAYKNYGGRGISVCAEWLKDKTEFFKWALSNGYKKGLQIDRIDNDGNYSPLNCRYVTPKENNRNRRVTRFLVFNGEKKSVAEWCEQLGITPQNCYYRIKMGWPIEDILNVKKRVNQHG